MSVMAILRSSGALNSTGEQIALISTNPSECPEAVAIDPAADTIASAWSDADSSGPVDNAIALYAIDPNTHALTLTTASPFSASGKGQDIKYDPSGKFVVVAQDDGIGVYQAAQNSVSEITGSPFAGGTDFNRFAVQPHRHICRRHSARHRSRCSCLPSIPQPEF
jgi:hypothetical protein